MKSSNNILDYFAENPGRCQIDVAGILPFEFSDGPERGLAIFADGQAVTFSLIGESRFKMFRAFELHPIVGDWSIALQAWKLQSTGLKNDRIILPSHTAEIFDRIEHDASKALAIGHYVGVGSPYLEWLTIAKISPSQKHTLNRQAQNGTGFLFAHNIIRQNRQESVL